MAKSLPPLTAPRVVLIGRTNAGKSSLFNRLSETGGAIVSAAKNTTRDQNRGMVYWKGLMCELIDTGGLDTAELDQLHLGIKRQVEKALKQAAIVLLVTDGKSGLMPQDYEVRDMAKALRKPIILCVNKIDSQKAEVIAEAEFAPLNIKDTIMVSASNGNGTNDLLDLLFSRLPETPSPATLTQIETIDIALVGRPNVGKSSLFNAFVGDDRVIVSDEAHTTRDINDTFFQYKPTAKDGSAIDGEERTLRLIDTAGIRRKKNVGDWSGQQHKQLASIEKMGVKSALNAVERADVILLVLEAQKKITNQDKTLVQFAHDHSKSLIIVINKWDIIPDKDSNTINEYIEYFSRHLEFSKDTPVLFTSALEQKRVKELLDLAVTQYDKRFVEVPQDILDGVMYSVKAKEPLRRKVNRNDKNPIRRPLEIHDFSQIDTDPPTFRLVTSNPKHVSPNLIRIFEKLLRERYDLSGVPVKIILRNS